MWRLRGLPWASSPGPSCFQMCLPVWKWASSCLRGGPRPDHLKDSGGPCTAWARAAEGLGLCHRGPPSVTSLLILLPPQDRELRCPLASAHSAGQLPLDYSKAAPTLLCQAGVPVTLVGISVQGVLCFVVGWGGSTRPDPALSREAPVPPERSKGLDSHVTAPWTELMSGTLCRSAERAAEPSSPRVSVADRAEEGLWHQGATAGDLVPRPQPEPWVCAKGSPGPGSLG